MKEIFEESRIIRFFINLNKNILVYFYNSAFYKTFMKSHIFFKDTVLKNTDKSLIIKTATRISKNVKIGDIGWFIVLVALFNTLGMVVLEKKIDIFSIYARILFFIFGIALIFRRKRCEK